MRREGEGGREGEEGGGKKTKSDRGTDRQEGRQYEREGRAEVGG